LENFGGRDADAEPTWMYSRRFSEQVPGLPKLDDVALVMARGFNSLVQRVV